MNPTTPPNTIAIPPLIPRGRSRRHFADVAFRGSVVARPLHVTVEHCRSPLQHRCNTVHCNGSRRQIVSARTDAPSELYLNFMDILTETVRSASRPPAAQTHLA